MKLVLLPSDSHFRANLDELHAAKGSREPTRYEIVLRGGNIETRSARIFLDQIAALSADGLHEAQFPLEEVVRIVAHFDPRHLLCIMAPSKSNSSVSCAILTTHSTHEAAEWHAMDYFSDLGFRFSNYTELLRQVRESEEYDIVLEAI